MVVREGATGVRVEITYTSSLRLYDFAYFLSRCLSFSNFEEFCAIALLLWLLATILVMWIRIRFLMQIQILNTKFIRKTLGFLVFCNFQRY